MKSFVLFPALLVSLSVHAQEDARAKAEALVSKAAQFAREAGADKLVQEVNRPQGRFGNREAMNPQLIIYDLKGIVLAHSRNVSHVGMNHSRAIASLLEFSKTHRKGWFDPSPGTGSLETTIFFEQVEDILITAPPHFH